MISAALRVCERSRNDFASFEPGLLDPALDGSSFQVDHLKFGQAQQVA